MFTKFVDLIKYICVKDHLQIHWVCWEQNKTNIKFLKRKFIRKFLLQTCQSKLYEIVS